MGSTFRALCIAACLIALSACDDDGPTPSTCAETHCPTHATCVDDSGGARCLCLPGYDGDQCDQCAPGYQDHDQDQVCRPTCTDTLCHGGTCDDASGTVRCTCPLSRTGTHCEDCAEGYQDHDGDGHCRPDCAQADLTCSARQVCDDASGEAQCACVLGYAGDGCLDCAPGWQDNAGTGECRIGCELADIACGPHGRCSDATGYIGCACDPGYAGNRCQLCANHWQDHDTDGLCTEACTHPELSCGHGTCDDTSGTALCLCDEGYTGVGCSECADQWQDNDGDGLCAPACAPEHADCHGHGTCDDTSGQILCACDPAYVGTHCDTCAHGYQDNDGDGTCLPTCANMPLPCGANSTCSDLSGEATCTCFPAYTGPNCDQCATGYQDHDGDGVCSPSCANLGYTCSGKGTCSDASGTARCVCDAGYVNAGPNLCVINGTGVDCSSPLWLDLGAGTITGNTQGAGNHAAPSCQSNHGQERVYAIDVPETLTIEAVVSGFDTVMYLRRVCNDPATEIACDDDGGPGTGSRIVATLEPGTAYLFVDGYGSAAGAFTLTLQVQCPSGKLFDPASATCVPDPCVPNPCHELNRNLCNPLPPASFTCECNPGYSLQGSQCVANVNPSGNTCADVIALPTGVSGSVTGSTASAANSTTGTCGGTGPDRVYGFFLSEAMRVSLTVDGYDSVIYLRRQCDKSQSEVTCNDDYDGYGGGSRIIANLDAGAYYLWVDSYSSGGAYTLTYGMHANPCNADPCPGTPECQASADWSTYACVCPLGMLPHGATCVDDPCDPNPCTQSHKTKCVPDLPGAYTCACNIGYIPDGAGGCVMDPNANEWAFIVFLNADNNLESYGYEDVDEMCVAGSTPYVHIVALFDTYDGPANVIYVQQGSYDIVANWGEADMGDWQTLRDFGVWAVENYPARHYAFIMWNHGDGWKKRAPHPILKGFSNDDHGSYDGISISNGDYARAMGAITQALGGKIDIVGFDACLMGMWEIAEATAPFADYLVASSETEPAPGWSYHAFLPQLTANPTMSAVTLGQAIIDSYHAESSRNATLAMTDLNTVDPLATALTNFANAMMANPSYYSTLRSIRSQTQDFYESDYRDLRDFTERVSARSGVPADIKAAADALLLQLDSSIVYNRAQSDYPGAHGLAIYFPASSPDPDYSYGQGAVWSQRTTWDEFLRSL